MLNTHMLNHINICIEINSSTLIISTKIHVPWSHLNKYIHKYLAAVGSQSASSSGAAVGRVSCSGPGGERERASPALGSRWVCPGRSPGAEGTLCCCQLLGGEGGSAPACLPPCAHLWFLTIIFSQLYSNLLGNKIGIIHVPCLPYQLFG